MSMGAASRRWPRSHVSPRGRTRAGARRTDRERRSLTSTPGRVLSQVLDLAGALPIRPRGELDVSASDPAALMSDLGDQLLAVHDALDGAGIPHAIGGAIALGYCTLEPRGTRDLDVNVFVGPERAREVFAALPRGRRGQRRRELEQAERDGQVRSAVWDHAGRSVPQRAAVPRRGRRRTSARFRSKGARSRSSSCTALAVFKAMFDRTQDWADIEAMVEARALDLDEAMSLD